MANKRNVHTTFNKQASNWRNITEGATRPIKTYATKKEATYDGRTTSKNRQVEHLVHNRDGEIGYRNSYGHDPRKIKG